MYMYIICVLNIIYFGLFLARKKYKRVQIEISFHIFKVYNLFASYLLQSAYIFFSQYNKVAVNATIAKKLVYS